MFRLSSGVLLVWFVIAGVVFGAAPAKKPPVKKGSVPEREFLIGQDSEPAVGQVGPLYYNYGWRAGFKVVQVVDENNVLGLIKVRGGNDDKDVLVWFEMPTKGMTDDQKVDTLGQKFEVVGTKRYNAALGPKTVLLFKPKAEEKKADPPVKGKTKPKP